MVLRFAWHHQIENNVAFFLFLMQCTYPSKNIASALCTIRTIKVVKQIRKPSLNKLTKGKLASKEFLTNKFIKFFKICKLELSCCKKQQKSPNQETVLENRGRLKVLNDTKLVLNEPELSP